MRAVGTLFETVRQNVRRQMPALFTFSFAANMLLLVTSIYMLQVFDRVLTSGSIDTLVWLTVVATVGLVVYGLVEQARRKLLTRVGTWIDGELTPEVLRRAINARLRAAPTRASLKDVEDLRSFIAGEGLLAFLDAPWMPIFLAVIFILHPLLGLIAVAGAIALFAFAIINDLATRGTVQRSADQQAQNRQRAQQMLANSETVSALGMTGPMLRRWQVQQDDLGRRSERSVELTTTLHNASRVIRLSVQLLILGTGAFLVLQGQLTAGGMIAASIILSRALSPVERSIGAWRGYLSARQSYRKLDALFAEDRPAHAMTALPAPTGELRIEGLRYAPPGKITPILAGVDLQLAPGTICGVLGPSGAGKSTLCRLIVGAWQPGYGHVRLDGADLSQWDPDTLGRHIGYLPQQIDLFDGTVAENIARMDDYAGAAVVAAAKQAGVHEMILRLPNGYDTAVGAPGAQLSGGERQRIALARALYGNPKLIVLDEPNANLDSDGETALLAALRELKASGRTVLVVAHEPGILRSADKLLVLTGGRVKRFGDRDEVLQSLMTARARSQETAVASASPWPDVAVRAAE